MDEQRQLLFVNHFLPSNEQKLIDRLKEAASRRITRPPEVTAALRDVPIDTIADIVIGPSYIGVLFTDGQVGRFPYVATSRPLEPSASPAKSTSIASAAGAAVAAAGSGGGSGSGGPTGSGAPGGAPGMSTNASLISRTAKFRRVMLATSGRRDHRSVIIDRARPMVPAASVPEDLIAQAQVVLQGKSREVIVRELQRTNLNVNEAVNNLLSRDDDDDDGSEGGGTEMCIPEELLSLLDSTHGSALLESDLYGADSFEYLLSSRERKSRAEKEKEKQKSTKPVIETNSDTEALRRYEVPTGSITEPWEGLDNKEAVVNGAPRFTHIACTQSELLALSTDSKLYGWKWSEPAGDPNPHMMYHKMQLAEGESLTHISACSLRVAVMTSHGRMATWLDTVACGERLSEALFVPPQKLNSTDSVEQLAVSNQLAMARFPNNVFYWCGLYPVNDRRRIFEKARSRQRKHVTFDTTQIVEGSEVRTKSGPIYSIGCIAANLAGPTPMIGILMENAWSLSEMCRFRLLDPAAYDSDRTEGAAAAAAAAAEGDSAAREAAVAQQALASGNRKRPATDEVFPAAGGGETKLREEAWMISDVIFIHEEVQNDTAVVTIVDGGYCAVEFQKGAVSATERYATAASKQLARKGEGEKPQQKTRLIRKDELTVVSAKMRYAKSPNSMRIEPFRFVLSGSTSTKKVISAVADSLGFRALVERRGGQCYIMRVSVCGRTLTQHPLPLHAAALYDGAAAAAGGRQPQLINYGDDGILLLRDACGGLIPLVRDAAAGFKEPTYLQLPASSVTALTVKSVKDKDRPTWASKANREAVILTLQGTHPRTLECRLPSLLYAVQCCDEKAVAALLDAFQKEEDLELSKREIVESRADGHRNVLHAAVMGAYATKNALEADVETPIAALTTPEMRSSADAVRISLDKKWNEMLKTRSSAARSASSVSTASSGPPAQPVERGEEAAGSDASMEVVIVPESQVPTAVVKVEVEEEGGDDATMLISPSPVENAKQRQENSIAIVKMLVTHPICMPFLTDLLGTRDIHGQTPFMAAVNHRAYSAARFILDAITSLFVQGAQCSASSLAPFIFPAGARPDDSPLFILCYNDTCSFTWTGDEHINQDIFECRTCGLTGSLCCCTECAFTCHRNHDCKLKRTSPTAYCDCWEKACCKALVSGNQHARMDLLMKLIDRTNLYTLQNRRGEHILLYLARKLSRQSSEQWNYTRRPRRVAASSSARGEVPEHDLEPPKFARNALLYCLRNWNVVKSMAMIGVRTIDSSLPMAEDVFHLNAQHGSSHLDKFMLILMTKAMDDAPSVMEKLIAILVEAHNTARDTGKNLEEVNFVISRYVRSVARLFILAVIISGAAASTAVSGIVPKKESSGISTVGLIDRPLGRSITFSGIFGHLRSKEMGSKDTKKKTMGVFIMRCKAFFEHFAVFTLHEMAQLADASLAPVRTGMMRPCVALATLLGPAADSLESLEKYINAESDASGGVMGRGEEEREERKEAKKRRKKSSRRDTDHDEPPSETAGGGGASERSGGEGGERRDSDSDSDSDSDDDGPSSRRHASQSSALAANEEPASANAEETSRRSGGEEEYSTDDDEEVESDSEVDRREDEEDEEEEEEEEQMRREEEEEEDAEMEYGTSEGDAPTSAAGEERGEGGQEGEERREEGERGGEEERREGDEDEPMSEQIPEFRVRYVGSSEGSRSPSSPSYSSGEEEESARGAGRERRRPKPAAAAADAANANEDAAGGEGEEEAPREVERHARIPNDPNSTSPLRRRPREGSARTRIFRPEMGAPSSLAAAAAGGVSAAPAAAAAAPAADSTPATGNSAAAAARREPSFVDAPVRATEGSRGSHYRVRSLGVFGGDDRMTSRRNASGDVSRVGGGGGGGGGRRERSEWRTVVGGSSSASGGGGATGSWHYRRPLLPPWLSRSSEGEGGRGGGGATGARGTAAAASSSTAEEKKTEGGGVKEDEVPSAIKTGVQLAAAFSFAVRVICELMPRVAAGGREEGSTSSLDKYCIAEPLDEMEEAVRKRAVEHVFSRLEDSWRWLAVVLDHVETQIKYINAVTSAEESRKREGKEKRKSQRRKSPSGGDAAAISPSGAAGVSATAAGAASTTASPQPISKVKRETMSILMGVLRAHSGEAADDVPMIDLELLRAPALVVDAYLAFVEAKADTERAFEASKVKEMEVDVVEVNEGGRKSVDGMEGIETVRRFYQRSNSVSFPGASFTDAHDTLAVSCMQSLPIVERPQLLTSTVEKEVIFGPPPSTQERTKEEHDKVILSHGIAHPHNQSLTTAAVSSHRLFVEEKREREKEVDHAVGQMAVVIPAVASAPSQLNEMSEKKKSGGGKGGKRGRKRGRGGEIKPNADEETAAEEVAAAAAAVVQPPPGFERVTYEEILETFNVFREHPLRKLMGRWRFTLQLIARELHEELTDTLGGELTGSALLRELAGFEMKQNELRGRMEKMRATATKDINLEIHRDPGTLLKETCFQLNRAYTRRMAMKGAEGRSASFSGSSRKEDLPPLASHKVKVRFVDEPGEGTGVARSYFTALAEAVVSLRTLPFTDYGYNMASDDYLYGGPTLPAGGGTPGSAGGSASSRGENSVRRLALIRGRDAFLVTSSGSATRRKGLPFDRRLPLTFTHPPYLPVDMTIAEGLDISPAFLIDLREETYMRRDNPGEVPAELMDRLYIIIRQYYPAAAARITGMMADLPLSHIILVLGDITVLKGYMNDAIDLMMQNAAGPDMLLLRGEEERRDMPCPLSTEADDSPLFFRPSKKAHYSPVPGRLSPIRISAFRNVGRVIGLCLLQCEMFPLRLSRHVLKYILGRPLNWHDFAFYDPQMFESLRKLIVEGCSSTDHTQYFDDLQLTFSVDMPPDATGLPAAAIDLVPGGSEIVVTKDNVIEYVYRFVEAKLLGTANGRCLAAMKQGVHDVVPQSMLDNLTAEDLRLVLCGTETVSLSLMQSYTAWTDESHAAPETIAKYKQWFWQVAERLSPSEKQDLIFFWTGAPSLPSTEEGFQPLPTIVIRPSDDGFLPTANTCISRLYLPLYNSKKTLAAKIQLAIKAKNFGFV